MTEVEHKVDDISHMLSPFDLVNGAANKLDPPAGFDGPTKRRRVTDPLCLIVLLSLWGFATWIGIWSIQNGKLEILAHPADYKGRLCGVEKDSNGNILPGAWHLVDTASNGICIDKCPSQSNLEPTAMDDLLCKEAEDILQIKGCLSNGNVSDDPLILVTCGACMYEIGSSNMNDYCTPVNMNSITSKLNGVAKALDLDKAGQLKNFDIVSFRQKLIRDIRTAYPVVCGVGYGGSIVLGTIFLILLRYSVCIGPIIWTSAALVPLALGGAGTLLFFLSNEYELDQTGLWSDLAISVVKVLAFGSWVVSGIFLISIVLMKNKIRQAISISKVSSSAIKEVPFVVAIPFVQTVAFGALVGSLLFWMLMLAAPENLTDESSTVFESEISYISREYPAYINQMCIFLIFVAFWTSEFILVLGKVTISLCFSKWFYTPEKENGNTVSISTSMATVLVKHAGTAAFGSLLTKPISLLRSPILFIQSAIKRSSADNACIDAIICCCQCNLFILERFLKFANTMAYHHTSIFGSSFCKSSHESYYLQRRNEEFVREAGCAPFISVVYCKTLIVCGVSLVSFIVIDTFYQETIHSIVAVTFFVAILSWFVTNFFTDILGFSISTFLYCFVADEEIMGSEGSPFVTPELYDFLDQIYDSENLKRINHIEPHEFAVQ